MVSGLPGSELLQLIAHCVSLGVSAVRNPLDRRAGAWAHADGLAEAAGLDMTRTWTVSPASYLGRVTKARIVEAVREAAGEGAAARLDGLKKADMVEAAAQALAGTGWLPPLLRTKPAEGPAEAAGSEPMLAAE